jgi:RHS repeat-associated protein
MNTNRVAAAAAGITAFIHRRPDGTVLNARTFTRDALARLAKAQRVRPGTAPAVRTDTFAHNARSELVHAASGTNAFDYLYDGIGGRELAAENAATNLSAANGLNPYTSVSTSAPSAPPYEFTPVFDADGNQTLLRTETGVWHVQYNAENRPVTFTSDDGAAVVTLAYDYLGRCFRRIESHDGTVASHEHYIYRDDLRIAALDMLNNAAAVHTAVWDPTEPAATRPLLLQTPSGWFTCGFDQVKNVTELFDSSGNIAATYDHGPFGENMTASGPAAALNPFRFSSEVWDATLGLVDYTFRPYNPFDGRFLNRDPIGEDGGLNLYGFASNDPVDRVDHLGLVGRIEISHWQKDFRGDTRRSWLVGVLWYPPDEWKEKKTECLPCKKVVWTQKWRRHFVLLGGIETHSSWLTDWDESTSYKFGEVWTAGGKSQRASFFDSPGLLTINGLGMLYTAFHFEFVSTAKCIEGDDTEDVYAIFKWHVNWGRATDQIEAAHEME